jgi:hypothetical protein
MKTIEQYGLVETASARRHFTYAEANRAIVLVKRILSDIVREHARMLDLQEVIEASHVGGSREQEAATLRELMKTIDRLQSYVEEADEVGVEVRDWRTGLVEFPAIVGGREVFFSWKLGESRIRYWSEEHPSHAGRKPIDTFPLEVVPAF